MSERGTFLELSKCKPLLVQLDLVVPECALVSKPRIGPLEKGLDEAKTKDWTVIGFKASHSA